MGTKLKFVLLAAALVACAPFALADSRFGHFVGKFVAEFDVDGRKVKLMEPYSFVDPEGTKWDVPAGYLTDGASVPSALWALYPPFTGAYRSAAVIHDYYCDNQERSWQDTHKVFYNAMRASDVDEKTAKIMFGAVYLFGPRWGPGTAPGQRNAAPTATQAQQEETVEALKAFVEEENPDLDTLISKARRMGAKPGGLRETPE
ncbi:MAG: DUF1353 domain-containing protein [Hyphomicrobiales bacterium]